MGDVEAAVVAVGVGDQDDGQAGALDGIQYCSEHGSAAAAAGVAGGGICALCLQEKLGMLISSSKSSPFFPLGGHPPPSASPSSPPSFRARAAEPPLPLPSGSGRSRKFAPFHRKKSSSSSSSAASATLSTSMSGGGGLKRSKSVAPRPEEQQFSSFASSSATAAAESPRKKSFWSFLHHSSSSSYYAHHTDSDSSSGGTAARRRKSVSVASAAWASRGGAAPDQQQLRSGHSAASGRSRMEAIGEPPESPIQSRKVSRSRSLGCGSRSFSGDFLERLSFGDCGTLRRVESQREPKTNKMRAQRQGHLGLGGAEDDDGDVYEQQNRIKCAGFFGPTSSSYWLSTAAEGAAGCTRKPPGSRSHRSWAWASALASPMRALRPTSSTSTKIITAEPSTNPGGTPAAALSISSPMPSSLGAAAATN